uniref:Variant surface glycoprotein 1125.1252 n=1 Tax=Trypanosoma brucei TaxID=5691 RepID=A0A1J0R6I1_9TRYP|nr:variant surface glycoprotein 1125.1252 [Trypanosoma brucei]
MHHQYPLAAVQLVAILAMPAAATPPDGANKEYFKPLCTTIRWAEGTVEISNDAESIDEDYDAIQELNMSLADGQWREKWANPPKTTPAKEVPKEAEPADDVTSELKKNWVKAAAAAKTTALVNANLKKAGLDKASKQQLRAAQAKIQRLAAAAFALRQQYTAESQQNQVYSIDKIKQQINKAVYGQDTKPASGPNQPAAMSTPSSNGRATQCDTAADGSKIRSIAGLALCLCAESDDSSDGTAIGVPCGTTTAQKPGWPSNAGDINTQYDKLAKYCGKGAKITLTATEAIKTTNTILNNFKFDDSKAYYGTFVATACDGSQAKGACYSTTKATAANPEGVKKLPWLEPLIELASMLAAHSEKLATTKQHRRALAHLKATAYNLGRTSANIQPESSGTSGASAAPQQTSPAAADCTTFTTNTTCTADNNCKWDSTTETTGNH